MDKTKKVPDFWGKEDWQAVWIGFIVILIACVAVLTKAFDFSAVVAAAPIPRRKIFFTSSSRIFAIVFSSFWFYRQTRAPGKLRREQQASE